MTTKNNLKKTNKMLEQSKEENRLEKRRRLILAVICPVAVVHYIVWGYRILRFFS